MAQGENLQQNDTYVSELAEALRSQVSLSAVPGLLKQVIKNDMWRRRIVRQTRQSKEYNRFADFVKDYPPDGLGSNMNVLMSLCRFHEDIEAVDLLSKVDAGKEGGNNNQLGINQYTEVTVDNINSDQRNTSNRPTGTSAAGGRSVSQANAKRLGNVRYNFHR